MKKILAVVLSLTMMFSGIAVYGFSDTESVAWAETAIDFLAAREIVNGYEDGTFRPQNNVTRAEFAKILCLAFDCNDTVSDVDLGEVENHWAFEYIIRTYGDVWNSGDYEPDAYASRAEIAYALANVLDLEKATQDMNLRFPHDWDSVDDRMRDKVASVVEAGLIEGYEDGKIRADGFVTRAELAVLIVRAMNYTPQNQMPDDDLQQPPEDVEIVEPNPDDEINDESEQEENDIFEGLDHIYTVYPVEEIYIVTGASRVLSEETGAEACRITYKIACGGNEEYSSVIEEDTRVYGVKSNIFSISTGDAFIVDMTFLTRISGIYVLASFDAEYEECISNMYVPNGRRIAAYGADTEYEVLCGKLVGKKINSKSVSLTVEFSGREETVHVLKGVEVDKFESGRRLKWETASALSLDEEESTAVYIRLTNGKVTEVMACEY